MTDVFQIIPEGTIDALESKLDVLFQLLDSLHEIEENLVSIPTDVDFLNNERLIQQQIKATIAAVNAILIQTSDLIENFKGIDDTIIRRSNGHYARYGLYYSVENLAWYADHIFNTFEEPLRNKVGEGLVSVSEPEDGGHTS